MEPLEKKPTETTEPSHLRKRLRQTTPLLTVFFSTRGARFLKQLEPLGGR